MRFRHLFIAFVFLAACTPAASRKDGIPDSDDGTEMGSGFAGERTEELFVEPSSVQDERARFSKELAALGRNASGKRVLYEQSIDVIGANGVLEGIEGLWPKCHSEAHDLGKVIFDRVKNVGLGLRICADGCYSGCMHGVLMEAFAGARTGADVDPEQHVDAELVKKMMDEICAEETMTSSYSPGDCAHATGHALMVLTDYHVDDAIRYCDAFSTPHMRYYCATGAYMEYVTERDKADVVAGMRALYPCDVGKYPAACARYKMVHVIRRLVKNPSDVQKLVRSCNQLAGAYKLGCYHGAGNGFMGAIASEKISLLDVCGQGGDAERFVCIEGAMERMAKLHPERAVKACKTLERGSTDRETCEAAGKRGMYDMEKDLALYLN